MFKKFKKSFNKFVDKYAISDASYTAAIFGLCLVAMILSYGHTESYIYKRVVKLESAQGTCSGEQVQTKSGQDYILTAAHCKVLADKNGNITVVKSDGSKLQRRIIAEDPNSDLLLLEGLPNLKGLSIANKIEMHQDIRTFTHGAGFKAYKTEGIIVDKRFLVIPLNIITSEEENDACSQPKNKIFDLFIIKVCALAVEETATTALIVPGSSGGMVVNNRGDLIGVVSAGGGGFGYLVNLEHIKAFLSAY